MFLYIKNFLRKLNMKLALRIKDYVQSETCLTKHKFISLIDKYIL